MARCEILHTLTFLVVLLRFPHSRCSFRLEVHWVSWTSPLDYYLPL